MAEPPRRPTSEAPTELGFVPERKMTPWLSPSQLLGTALNVLLSAIFGSYSDKREIQGGLASDDPPEDYSDRPELWVDFVADLGDAFGPTYTMATLLADKALELEGAGGTKAVTNRGQVLVMGGDEVYPTASVRDYENKTVGPYRAALPWVENEDEAPHLYVIPGNHDWYDGLTGWMRIFCRKQWIGGWQTQQSRSYFAVQLPKRWWLWGIDIQFDSYIDEPQFRYFQKVAERLEPGDSVILCTAKPSWTDVGEPGGAEAYATLDYIERRLVRPNAEVRLALTGDAHHYARYAQVGGDAQDGDGRAQKITAGGGGAFLSATHHLPTDVELPPRQSLAPGKTSPPTHWKLRRTYPSARESRRLRRRVARLPFDNAGMWAFVGGVHVAYSWMSQAAHRRPTERFHQVLSRLSYDDIARGLARSPLAVLVSAGLVRGLVGFTQAEVPVQKWGLGLAHSGAQLGAVVLSAGTAAGLCSALGLTGLGYSAGFVVLVGVGGGLLGCGVMAGYLLVADRFKLNANELFSAQRNRDWKNFLRLHVGEDGTVTVYPIGVAKTPRKWRLRRGGAPDDPWFEPVDGPVVAHLIEEPIRVDPASAVSGAVTASAAAAPPDGSAAPRSSEAGEGRP